MLHRPITLVHYTVPPTTPSCTSVDDFRSSLLSLLHTSLSHLFIRFLPVDPLHQTPTLNLTSLKKKVVLFTPTVFLISRDTPNPLIRKTLLISFTLFDHISDSVFIIPVLKVFIFVLFFSIIINEFLYELS